MAGAVAALPSQPARCSGTRLRSSSFFRRSGRRWRRTTGRGLPAGAATLLPTPPAGQSRTRSVSERDIRRREPGCSGCSGTHHRWSLLSRTQVDRRSCTHPVPQLRVRLRESAQPRVSVLRAAGGCHRDRRGHGCAGIQSPRGRAPQPHALRCRNCELCLQLRASPRSGSRRTSCRRRTVLAATARRSCRPSLLVRQWLPRSTWRPTWPEDARSMRFRSPSSPRFWHTLGRDRARPPSGKRGVRRARHARHRVLTVGRRQRNDRETHPLARFRPVLRHGAVTLYARR